MSAQAGPLDAPPSIDAGFAVPGAETAVTTTAASAAMRRNTFTLSPPSSLELEIRLVGAAVVQKQVEHIAALGRRRLPVVGELVRTGLVPQHALAGRLRLERVCRIGA